MTSADDKNWELIQKLLEAEASGKQPHLFSSRRTLFGIPSELDRELAEYAARESIVDEKSARGLSREFPDQELGRELSESTSDSHEESCARGTQSLRQASHPCATAQAPAHVGSRTRFVNTPGTTLQPDNNYVEHPLQPVFDDQSRVLILGTIPSPKSRETGFYYNNPQNRFWKVMAHIFAEPLPQTNDEKEQLMLKHHVALWDVLASCTIDGAKDVSIAECVPNNIALITTKAPIKAIFCTGAKAAELYTKYCQEQTGMSCIKLPSTSPANAACSLDKLIEAYQQITTFLQDE